MNSMAEHGWYASYEKDSCRPQTSSPFCNLLALSTMTTSNSVNTLEICDYLLQLFILQMTHSVN